MTASSVVRAQGRSNLEMLSKIKPYHRMRRAVVYVRQSTPKQVKNNQESAKLQRSLKEVVLELGWREEQIEVIDEDLGRSGTSRAGRPGFERLLAEIDDGEIGLVLSLDISRLSRSNYDWQMLVWVCHKNGTLVGEQGKLYDSNDLSEELFLSIKGAISTYEGRLIQMRMQLAKEAKAQRGELKLPAPMGYVWEGQQLVQDPDEQVRERIALVFAQFERLGSVHKVVGWFNEQGLLLPARPHSGPNKGQLQWVRAKAGTILYMLRNPIYSGAYVYGRRKLEAGLRKSEQPYSGVRVLPPEQWKLNLPDRHRPYISPEQYEENLQRLRDNSPKGLGAPRGGPSLLAGLLYCGHCGGHMQVQYSNNGSGLRYSCIKQQINYAGPRCQMLSGQILDKTVEDLLLEALEPLSVEVELAVLENFEAEHQRLVQAWEHRLEEARYQVCLTESRYKEVDPKNRLVARTLENEWQSALDKLQHLQADYQAFGLKQPAGGLSESMKEQIRRACSDVRSVWHASSTTAEQRRSIARLMLKRVEVTVHEKNEKVRLRLFWAGGDVMDVDFVRPVAKTQHLSFYPQMLQQLEQLLAEGLEDSAIAERLNGLGYHSARGDALQGNLIGQLRRQMGWSRGGGRADGTI